MLHTWDSLNLAKAGKKMELEADVVVVGSGAGGAPIAYELAGEGHSVILLEEGGYYPTEEFRFDCKDSVSKLYRNGGLTFSLGMPIIICPVGRSIGGTTTINQGTSLRIPPAVLKEWQTAYGLYDINAEEMSLYYNAVEEFLFVKKADPEVAGKNAAKFIEGAKKLGMDADYLPRNAKDCEGYGVCSFGCPTGSKQSTNVSYIPEAVKRGAEVYADCKVKKVITENGKATGVEAQFIKADTGQAGPRLRVNAKVIVLSGGTVGTPLLLMGSRLANSSKQVGKNLRIHPCSTVTPVYDEEITPMKGISQSAWVHDFLSEGLSLETTVLPPDMLAMTMPAVSDRHAAIMSDFSHSGLFAAMVKDTTRGRLIPRPGGQFALFYQINREDLRRMQLGNILISEIAFAAGAKKVFTFIAGHTELRGRKDVERLRESRIGAMDYLALSAWHPMGTCRMGSDPSWSVVNHTGETWDVPNLFISDASTFPTALGVNPQLTIMVQALRIAGHIDERLGG